MSEKAILLVEDNPDDELLTLDALAANRIGNKVVVARNGVEALDYLFATGDWAGRDVMDWPAVVLLDSNYPRLTDWKYCAASVPTTALRCYRW